MNIVEHGAMGVTGRTAALRCFSDVEAKLTGRLNVCIFSSSKGVFWALRRPPRSRGKLIRDAERKKMEILIYALGASYAARSQQECVVTEPEEFQPFNLQWLRNSTDNKPSRSSSRRDVYIPKTA
jgi:hypothetical protein